MRAEYICPVLTAFDENGKVDMEAMKRQFDHLIEGGLNGIAIMGSSGEFYAMTLEEAMAFARDSIAYLKGKIPVYIGTGRLIADETIQFSNYVLDQGATAVMVVGPYYIGTDGAPNVSFNPIMFLCFLSSCKITFTDKSNPVLSGKL